MANGVELYFINLFNWTWTTQHKIYGNIVYFESVMGQLKYLLKF